LVFIWVLLPSKRTAVHLGNERRRFYNGLVFLLWWESDQFNLAVYGDGLCIEDDVHPYPITVQEAYTDARTNFAISPVWDFGMDKKVWGLFVCGLGLIISHCFLLSFAVADENQKPCGK
jgi:hypothetical protein